MPPTLILASCRRALVATLVAATLVLSLTVAGASGSPVSAPAGPAGPSQAASAARTSAAVPAQTAKRRADPRYRRGLFVDEHMSAYQAGGIYRTTLGTRAQALWITDYYNSPRRARKAVAAYTSRAAAQGKTPVLAIYAIPGRDCGFYSSGGLSSYRAYRAWTTAVARGMRGHRAIVIVEPDAVAFMGDSRCVHPGPRQRAITFAVKRFARAGAWVYLDAGHSGWRDPAMMASLLKRSGMKWSRGFSTNVGNHRRTRDERGYGIQVIRELRKIGLQNRKYVIETARNGANPAPANGDVCNPWSARVGRSPRMIFRGALDGYLWIKNPGESDGTCNGGPAAGVWWPAGADSLLGRG